MDWRVKFVEEFDPEFESLEEAIQDELLAKAKLLEAFGPELGRPHVDTLNDSKHPNMKELRFSVAAASGGLHLPSIRPGRRFFWWLPTRPASSNGDFIAVF